MQYWQDRSLHFMSEESDDPNDSNCLIVHKLPWLSESECEHPRTYMSQKHFVHCDLVAQPTYLPLSLLSAR